MNHQLMIRAGRKYRPATPDEVSEAAATYLANTLLGQDVLANPRAAREFLRSAIGGRTYESFSVLLLDNRHRVLRFDELFRGTIDGASVYPREVVKTVLAVNAAAVVLAHNHPSGNPEPSQADELITKRLRDALALIDVRVIDHIIVGPGNGYTSFAERGLL